MKEQFRLLSPQSLLASLGLSHLPFRTAVLPAAAALSPSAEKVQNAIEYIRRAETRKQFICPDFPSNADWINSRPLSFSKQLSGKIVLLDFFTYCCINCQHVLPKLRALEAKYGEDGSGGVVVVGVHSAKFSAERETANVAAAVERYEVQHPVVNDDTMKLWNAIGVMSWPTLALLGPKGNVLALWSGENQEGDIDTLITAATEFYADVIDHRPLPAAPKRNAQYGQLAKSPLRYPGKLALSADAASLWVADSGNHRILQLDVRDGRVHRSFGSGEPGFRDSSQAANAQFHTPQGIVEHGGMLYVADTESHAVRAIDLQTGAVGTVGGNGEQGFDYQGGKTGTQQALSSPWDVEVCGDGLYVAMAGTHQIWRLGISAEGQKPGAGRAWEVFSGSGRELEKNSADGRIAAWAQPSHLSLAAEKGLLYVADSESSSVRAIEMEEGRNPTRTIAGGDGLIPENLFAFGDAEGRGSKARFQHPLAVCFDNTTNQVYVADSYNHRIKVVDSNAVAKEFCGSGKPGFKDGAAKDAMFWEPAGLAISPDGKKLYVSDTNNFAIRVVDTQSRKVSTLQVSSMPPVASSTTAKPLIPNRRRAVRIPCDDVKPSGSVRLDVTLPEKSHYTPGTTNRYQVNLKRDASSDDIVDVLAAGKMTASGGTGSVTVDFSNYRRVSAGDEIEIESVTYYCTEADDVCRVESNVVNVTLAEEGSSANSIVRKIAPRPVPTMGASV